MRVRRPRKEAGIRIGVNWSWLIEFALIVWTLESTVFPASNPGLVRATYVLMAVGAAILFFASLLLHELGHALQAKRDGVEIGGITLWLFGGVARLKSMFPSAGEELRIAVAGPLVSLLLGGLFVAVAAAGGLGSAVDGVAAWLGYIAARRGNRSPDRDDGPGETRRAGTQFPSSEAPPFAL